MKSILAKGRSRLFLIVSLILAFGLLIFALFWFMVSPVGAAFFTAPVPAQEYIWAYVEIPKPLKTDSLALLSMGTPINNPTSIMIESTSTPVPVIVDTATPAATETPGELAMEILVDTPTPIYVEPTQPPYVPEQPQPSYSNTYISSKYILVDISEQHMYVYEGDTLIYSFVASTGMNNGTRAGTFAVQSKIPSAYGSTWDIWMPYWLGIYWSGGLENGIHALPILPNGATLWEGYLGRPISYGCVVLGNYEASLLYSWAEIGTTVEIRW